MAKRALIVGIDRYPLLGNLSGCVNDAKAMDDLISKHGPKDPDSPNDRDRNFDIVETLVSKEDRGVNQNKLNEEISSLFSEDENYEVALFYFAGHGQKAGRYGLDGQIMASNSSEDSGITMSSILHRVSRCKATHKVIILDCCFAGGMGELPFIDLGAITPDRSIIITSSTDTQKAKEKEGRGVFTRLFCDAAKGSASNLLGEVDPTMIFAQVYQAMSTMRQTPVLRANVDDYLVLRENKPDFSKAELRGLKKHFAENENFTHQLDPAYEPRDEARKHWMPRADPEKNRIFKLLQKFNRKGLVVPLDWQGNEISNMWDAAMVPHLDPEEDTDSAVYGACKLTPFGKYYRGLDL